MSGRNVFDNFDIFLACPQWSNNPAISWDPPGIESRSLYTAIPILLLWVVALFVVRIDTSSLFSIVFSARAASRNYSAN